MVMFSYFEVCHLASNENLHTHTGVDQTHCAQIKLVFDNSQGPAYEEREPLQERDLRLRFAEARNAAGSERVLLDRLGKTRGVVGFMIKAGGAAAEVRISPSSAKCIELIVVTAPSPCQSCFHCCGVSLQCT